MIFYTDLGILSRNGQEKCYEYKIHSFERLTQPQYDQSLKLDKNRRFLNNRAFITSITSFLPIFLQCTNCNCISKKYIFTYIHKLVTVCIKMACPFFMNEWLLYEYRWNYVFGRGTKHAVLTRKSGVFPKLLWQQMPGVTQHLPLVLAALYIIVHSYHTFPSEFFCSFKRTFFLYFWN